MMVIIVSFRLVDYKPSERGGNEGTHMVSFME
jgi:hypothetical protein